VGPKIAQRVVLDLKDKALSVMAMGDAVAQTSSDGGTEVIEPVAATRPAAQKSSAQAEALSALSNLGYSPGDAARAVAQAAGDVPDADTGTLIKAALKLLAPKG
jgi:Holliday junction DNA helicase RuvA